VKNAPFRTSVCHCKACQRRTGSAFGVGIYFKDEDFELLRGELKPYRFHPTRAAAGCAWSSAPIAAPR
jgi:hypothetical protein